MAFTHKFQLRFKHGEKKLYLADASTYQDGTVTSIIKSLVYPDGTVEYTNTNYGSPDITNASSVNSQEFDAPVDANGDIQFGDYTVIIGTQITGSTEDNGTHEKTFKYDFSFEAPTPGLNVTSDCTKSIITSEDTTDWGDDVESITRAHTLVYPASAEQADYGPYDEVKITVTPVWTRTWQAVLTATVVFLYDDDLAVEWSGKVESEPHEVDCEGNICALFDCMENLSKRLTDGSCQTDAERIRVAKKVEEMHSYYSLYSAADVCGNATKRAEYYEKMRVLLSSEGCSSCNSKSSVSKVVIPAQDTGYMAKWLFGTADPTSTQGYDGQGYINTTSWDVFVKENGSWTNIGNIKGGVAVTLNGTGAPTAQTGNNGDYYIDNANGNFYGPKAAGAWPGTPLSNITGPQGPGPASHVDSVIHSMGGPSQIVISAVEFIPVVQLYQVVSPSEERLISLFTSGISGSYNPTGDDFTLTIDSAVASGTYRLVLLESTQ